MNASVLYAHPAATTCRPILMFAEEEGLALDVRLVDVFAGEQCAPAYAALNPNQTVPLLVDGDFRLTESSAILKYLAEQCGSSAYPADLRERARVNALMDWFNTGVMRDLAYGVVYPQVMPHHRRADEAAQQAHLAWSRPLALRWLALLNDHLLGDGRPFLAGRMITLADYFAIGPMLLPELLGEDWARWPQIRRWLGGLKARPGFQRSHRIWREMAAAGLAATAVPA